MFKNLFSSLKNKISNLYLKNKKLFIFSLILIFILLVAFCSSFFKTTKKESQSLTSEIVVDSDDYEKKLESKIQNMLLAIGEVESASVMIVCDSTISYDYLTNITETSSSSGDTTSKTISHDVVFQKNGSNNLPIIVSSKSPKVVGVWVVINSVSASTKLYITNSICCVLNIDQSCISILQE